MATFFLDPVNGVDANDGLTFATRRKTITTGASAALIAPGDTIRIIESLAPTALSVNGTFTNGSSAITLASPLNITVDLCESGWTASANVTATYTTTSRQGTNALQLAVAAGFATGIMAYKALAGSTDFSTMQQLNAWIRSNTALGGGAIRIDLCSDAAGATAVDSFTVDIGLQPTDVWTSFVKDKGSALGSAIQSVAIVGLADFGAATFIFDDLFTSKAPASADCITLQSALSLTASPGGILKGDGLYKVQSVNGTTIYYDNHYDTAIAAAQVYAGATATGTVYVRQGLVGTMVTASGTVLNTVQDSGTQGSPITFSGGWSATDMATQTGHTYMVYPNSQGTFLSLASRSYVNVERFSCLNCYVGLNFSAGHHNKFTDCWILGARTYPMQSSGVLSDYHFTRVHQWGNANGMQMQTMDSTAFIDSSFVGTANSNPHLTSRGTRFQGCAFRQCTTTTIKPYSANADVPMFDSCQSSSPSAAFLDLANDADVGSVLLRNCLIENTSEVVANGFTGATTGSSQAFISQDHDQVVGAWVYLTNAFRAESEASIRHTASGFAAKLSPLSTAVCDADQPGKLIIATIYCNASTLVTVTAWFRRSNTGLTTKLVVPKQGAQVTSETSTAMAAAADAWEELTVTFTPAVAGVVEIYAYAYGGAAYSGYVDDVTASQA